MSFFRRSKPAPPTASSAPDAPPRVDAMTHVRGVGRHQELLAGPPRRVQVELLPWEKGDAITAMIGGERVGEIDFSPALHHVLLALRKEGLPLVIVEGEVRIGDAVPRYLAVDLPNPSSLKPPGKKSWAPTESAVNVHMTNHYQGALHALYVPKARRREAQVSFRTHHGGKFDGKPEGVLSLDGQVIGEFSAGADEKWAIILEDVLSGIPGRVMVTIWPGHGVRPEGDGPYWVDAVYRRTPVS